MFRFLLTLALAVGVLIPLAASAQDDAKTGGLSVKFTTPEGVEKKFETVTAELMKVDSTSGARETVRSEEFAQANFTANFDGVEPGNYVLFVYTGDKSTVGDANHPGAFFVGDYVTITAGETTESTIEYVEFDPSTLKGEAQFKGRLVTLKDKPLANREIRVVTQVPSAGVYEVARLVSDDEGYFLASGLKDGNEFLVATDGDNIIGKFTAGATKTQNFKIPPSAGSQAPDVAFKKLDTKEDISISKFKGKVVVLDFWATWCPPCQPAMEKFNTFREKHPGWGEKVELIALSTDNEADTAINHIKKKGWNNLYHAWGSAMKSDVGSAYAVTGIPTTFVIDQKGKIVARGHPMQLDIPGIVDGLLAEEKEAAEK